MPNQLCPPTYKPNGYVDIARVKEVKEGRLWGDQVYGYLTPHTPEIDTPQGWDYAAWFMNRFIEQDITFGLKER